MKCRPVGLDHERQIAVFAIKSRLPAMSTVREFVLKTVKALGLTIPQSLLLRADEVIQFGSSAWTTIAAG